jgi:hypothetical protein
MACFGSGKQSQLKLALLGGDSGWNDRGEAHRFGGPLTLWVHVLCVLFILKIGCFWLRSFWCNRFIVWAWLSLVMCTAASLLSLLL